MQDETDVENENSYDPYVYVVNEIGWDYNDEYYYQVPGGGGRPSQAFLTKKLAEEYVKDLNFQWFVSNLGGFDNPASYFPTHEMMDDPIFINAIKVVEHLEFDKDNHQFSCDEPQKLKKEQVIKMMSVLGINQYELIAVKLKA